MQGFLETFFTIYPKADDKELIYYGDDLHALNMNLSFVEISNLTIQDDSSYLQVSCTVKYKDNDTNLIISMPYYLKLTEQGNNKYLIEELG